jgi:Kef-type K+ transport system membrane component KefB
VALAVSAFPVLARILTDHGIAKTELGILLNTRGLMELVVLNVGLDLGVITPTLFAMIVIMALVTTLATTPLLAMVNSKAAGEPLLLRRDTA